MVPTARVCRAKLRYAAVANSLQIVDEAGAASIRGALVLLIAPACSDPGDEFLARVDLRKSFSRNRHTKEIAQRLPALADLVNQQPLLRNRAHDLFGVPLE